MAVACVLDSCSACDRPRMRVNIVRVYVYVRVSVCACVSVKVTSPRNGDGRVRSAPSVIDILGKYFSRAVKSIIRCCADAVVMLLLSSLSVSVSPVCA